MRTFKVTFSYPEGRDEYEVTTNGVDGALATATKKFEAKHKNKPVKDPEVIINQIVKDHDN